MAMHLAVPDASHRTPKPTKSLAHALRRHGACGSKPPLSARRCRTLSGSVEHTNRAKVGLTLSDS